MTEANTPAEESNVCVAVKIRPLSLSEVDDGCKESLYVTPGLPQVSTGQHTFTYDHVFGEGGTGPEQLYPRCIAPLVDGLFKGYNATVFAYGQTGSGKTYTMGSEYKAGGRCRGVIPDVINDIFQRIEAAKDRAVTLRVSFVEIHKEEVKDLLLPATSGPRPAVTIRETPNGDVALYGAVEREVRNREEMANILELGTLCRSTASTCMNNRSSRSHAIFTISVEQRRQVQQPSDVPAADDDGEDDDDAVPEEVEGLDDFLGAKMHLVDLAGSERAKRTKAEGARLREGIHINKGLLALGNVINAIVDNHKHVPYRDSKLTRLLQDSLGGNSRTVMIACVSPADSNFEESLNTLRYADRARHIRNKPVVNRDPVAAQLAALRTQIAQLQSENTSLKRRLAAAGVEGDGSSGMSTSVLDGLVERLTQENSLYEAENLRLKMELDELRQGMAAVTDKWHTAQAQCDLLRMSQASAARNAWVSEGGAAGDLPAVDIVKGYVARVAELEAEVSSLRSLAAQFSFTRKRAQQSQEPRTPGSVSTPGDHDMVLQASSPLLGDESGMDAAGEEEDDTAQHPQLAVEEEYFMAELAARTFNQEKMKKEVALLQRQLEAKEQKMVKLMKDASTMPALKQHYDRVLADLEAQRDTLVAERKVLMEKLAAASAHNEEERRRLEVMYKERIQQADEKLRELKRKEREYIAMQQLKQRTEEAHRRLAADIILLKQQKVAVQRQLDQNAKQFAAWRLERERELTQLRRQGRKDRATIQQLEALQAKKDAVLQRKISDANAARKRLKELQEANSRRVAGNATAASQQQTAAAVAQQQALGGSVEVQPNAQAPILRTEKDRRDWLMKEVELCDMSSEFRKVIEGELAQRSEASRKLKDLEKRLSLLDQVQPASPLFMAGGAGAMLPVSPSGAEAVAAVLGGAAALGPEAREKLLAKKKELEEKVAHHNMQIKELQFAWERQKSEEEQRGGGAADMRRWTGLRNTVECRELLRVLFRITVENKTMSNDMTAEASRVGEELDVVRAQLEGAQKKCAQYRKLAAALQGAAACVASAPQRSSVSTQDETDKQVDAVLEELTIVRGRPPPSSADENGMERVAKADADSEGPSDGEDVIQMPLRHGWLDGPVSPSAKAALKNKNIGGHRRSGSEKRDDLIEDYLRAAGHHTASSAGCTSVPSGAAGHYANGREGGSGGEGRSTQLEPSSANKVDDEDFTFSPHVAVPSNGLSAAAGTSTAAVPPPGPSRPLSPCTTPSGRRLAAGPSGGPWARSSANVTQSARPQPTWASSLRSSYPYGPEPCADERPGVSGLTQSNSVNSNGSLSKAAATTPTATDGTPASGRRPLGWTSSPNGSDRTPGSTLRDYRAAVLSSPHQSPGTRIAWPNGQTATGASSPPVSMDICPAPRSGSKPAGGMGYSPSGSLGSRDIGYDGGENQQPSSTSPRAMSAGAFGAGKGTPMSNMYLEKAQAARERNAALRVSMQKGNELQQPQLNRAVSGSLAGPSSRSLANGLVVAGSMGSTAPGDGGSRVGAVGRDSTGSATSKTKAIWR